MSIITHPHAGMLINQLSLIAKEIGELPTNSITDITRYPNKEQQQALIRRAFEDVTHAIWALEEYNNGTERDGYMKSGNAPQQSAQNE